MEQFRALYRIPASIIDTPEQQERGYVEHATKEYNTMKECEHAVRRGSEETHAYLTDYEVREVTYTEWVRI